MTRPTPVRRRIFGQTVQRVFLTDPPGPGAVFGVASTTTSLLATHYGLEPDLRPRAEPGALAVVDPVSLKVLASVTVGHQPRRLAVNGTGTRAYVVNYGQQSYSLSVVDLGSAAVIAEIPLGQVPLDVCYHPVDDRVYVTNGTADLIHVVDAGSSPRVLDTRRVGPRPYDIASDPDRGELFVVLSDAQSGSRPTEAVAAFDPRSHDAGRVMPCPPGSQPKHLAIGGTSPKLFVAAYGTVGGFAPSILVMNPDAPEESLALATGSVPRAVAVRTGTDLASCVLDSGDVITVDGATGTVVAREGGWGPAPVALAVDAPGGSMLVGDGRGGHLSVGRDATAATHAHTMFIEYDRGTFAMLSHALVRMRTAPSDPLGSAVAEAGFWVEVRDRQGGPLYRRVLHDFLGTRPDGAPANWHVHERQSRQTLYLQVPDLPGADSAVLVRSTGTGGPRAMAAFPLRHQES